MSEETKLTTKFRNSAWVVLPGTFGAFVLALGIMMSAPSAAAADGCYSKAFTWEDGCTYIDGNECLGPCPPKQTF